MTNNFNQSVTWCNFYACFSTHYASFWEQWLKEIVSCHPYELNKIDVLFYVHLWGGPCLTQVCI